MTTRQKVCGAVVMVGVMVLAGPAQAVVVAYQEDFNTFSNGSMNGQSGWATAIGDGVDIWGTTDMVVRGDGTDGASQNTSLFTIPSGVASITIESRNRMRRGSSFDQLVRPLAGGAGMFWYGVNATGWRIRRVDGSTLLNSNAFGDESIFGDHHEWFDVILRYDYRTDTGSLSANRVNGDGNPTTIATFSKSDLGLTAAMDDPEEWTGMLLRMDHTSDNMDNLRVSYTVPEPVTMTLSFLALAGLGNYVRKRR